MEIGTGFPEGSDSCVVVLKNDELVVIGISFDEVEFEYPVDVAKSETDCLSDVEAGVMCFSVAEFESSEKLSSLP